MTTKPPLAPAGKLFVIVALVEALTWTGLLVGMYLKYVSGTTDLGVWLFGRLHGLAFLAYVVVTVLAGSRLLRVREDYVPLLDLANQYGLPATNTDAQPIAVVVESQGQRLALEVDELLGQQQVVVKNLERNYRRIAGVAGATILGDGRVALIVDVGSLSTKTHAVPAAISEEYLQGEMAKVIELSKRVRKVA
jgi:hypothetical protein